MTGKKGSGAAWHQTTIVLQPDIFRQAVAQGIDISDACNRALAGLTGTEYRPLQAAFIPAPPPVIIARDGSLPRASGEPKKPPVQVLHPVINADDPAAPARVVQGKTPAKKVAAEPPAPLPAAEPAPAKEPSVSAAPHSLKKAPARKGRGTTTGKPSGRDSIKAFFSQNILRTDDPGEIVRKEELYDRFTRFCHEHRITAVPDRRAVTVALKNQFALTEKITGGQPGWIGIRLK
jgi:hypothetical protein